MFVCREGFGGVVLGLFGVLGCCIEVMGFFWSRCVCFCVLLVGL